MFYLNGTLTNKSSAWPSGYQLISLVTTMDVQANNFSNDRNIGGRYANGDLAELMVFNHAFTEAEVQMVEGYLAEKWGLRGSLPSTHIQIHPLQLRSVSRSPVPLPRVQRWELHFTYTITTDVSNPAFQAANLPQGLSCNLGTEVISGTPLAGGTYLVTLAAQSSTSNEFASATLTITIPISAPLLDSEAPGNLVMNGAKLKGSVINTGGRDANVTVYWGDTNAAPCVQLGK